MSLPVIVILVLIALFLVTLILFICQRNKNKELKTQLDNKTQAYKNLQEEFDLYRKAEHYRLEKEEQTNEKIDDLHSGSLSADDILPKRKG